MTRLRRAFRNPWVASLILSIGVFALVAAARELGLLQSTEFLAYDKFLAWRAGANIEFVQNIKLKGKEETTTIYRVIGHNI
jgi:CHASE2 domain-containing sensor protein